MGIDPLDGIFLGRKFPEVQHHCAPSKNSPTALWYATRLVLVQHGEHSKNSDDEDNFDGHRDCWFKRRFKIAGQILCVDSSRLVSEFEIPLVNRMRCSA